MAFGIPPKVTEEYTLDELSKQHFLVLAIEAAKSLKWNVSYISMNGFLAYTKMSAMSFCEEVTVNIKDDSFFIKSQCTGNQLMDWGKNQKNISKLIEKIGILKTSYTAEEVSIKFEELSQQFSTEDDDFLAASPLMGTDKIKTILSIFIPIKGYYVTPILILLNIIVYGLMLLSGGDFMNPDGDSLTRWGANFRPLTLDGEYWRLITACFVHIGLVHLLLNLYALVFVGLLLEPILGRARFLLAYLVTGVCGSVASVWWHEYIISAGASGAIFGLYGVFLTLLLSKSINHSIRKTMFSSILIFISYNLLNGFKLGSGVDNAAHLGGLVSGILVGFALIPSLKHPQKTQLKENSIAAIMMVSIIICYTIIEIIPADLSIYYLKMNEFAQLETMAIQHVNTDSQTDNLGLNQLMYTNAIWQNCLELMESFDYLTLPEAIEKNNVYFRSYCKTQIEYNQFLIKAFEENTSVHDNIISSYNQKIKALTDSIAQNTEAINIKNTFILNLH
jgi:rhomboid protease GluP